jgi:hypothetical protein
MINQFNQLSIGIMSDQSPRKADGNDAKDDNAAVAISSKKGSKKWRKKTNRDDLDQVANDSNFVSQGELKIELPFILLYIASRL